jgi:hypothetical protein
MVNPDGLPGAALSENATAVEIQRTPTDANRRFMIAPYKPLSLNDGRRLMRSISNITNPTFRTVHSTKPLDAENAVAA